MSAQYAPLINQLTTKYRLPVGLIGAVMRAESGGDPNVKSGAGALGLMQLMPATARGLGVTNAFDPAQNLEGGAKYLRQLMDRWGGDLTKTIASYNAGPGAVEKYGGVPPYKETQTYVGRVRGFLSEAGGATGASTPAAAASSAYGRTAAAAPAFTAKAVDPGRISQIQHAWSDAPSNAAGRIDREYSKVDAANAAGMKAAAAAAPMQSAGGTENVSGASGWFKTPNGWIQGRRPEEAGYQFLDRLGMKGFGLEHDAGNNQTTGGQHRRNSRHYSEEAVDFGTARNSQPLLDQWQNYLDQRRKTVGIVELLNEGDHIHAAVGN